MRIRYLIQQIIAVLGVSALIAVECPMLVNAQSDPRPVLEYATGRVWIGNQPYNPQFHRGRRIPIGTTINTEWNSRVVFTYYWPTTVYEQGVWLDAVCAKQVYMRNQGTYARWFSHTIKRYDTPGRCDVTDNKGLSHAQQRAKKDPSIVSITYYHSYSIRGKPDWSYSSQKVVSSQRQQKYFWQWWWQ
jgi:hypothetical protein